MNTKVLEYIVAIADEKSITRAAERFYLSHPALSRHLKNIETEMGTPLFTRTSTGMQLTPAGLIFINDARAILNLEQKMNHSLADMRRQQRHLIPVMVDSVFYNLTVSTVLPHFSEKHPDFTVDITKCAAADACSA
ncbi:MAG: LysR family transcriptional regulator [Clostridia bacterium]|nr:LysR family transcriptional regulator [Clostridia bacterium]